MKELLLVRHAKSSWDYPHLRDADRPLNKRGKRDAPYMASFVRSRGIVPTHLISSPAVRAFTTAEHFYEEFNPDGAMIWKESDLYFGSEEDFLDIIQNLDEGIQLPVFFSHNPTLTYFANRFTDNWIDNVPTCGVVHLESSSDLWEDLYFDNTVIRNLFFPKLIRKEYE